MHMKYAYFEIWLVGIALLDIAIWLKLILKTKTTVNITLTMVTVLSAVLPG